MKAFNDKISQSILAALRQSARLSWQALGKIVHLSPQACAERVRQMQDAGIISGFTLRESNQARHFITVFMAHHRLTEFENFLRTETALESADKISGDGCYHLVYLANNRAQLEDFLQRLSAHARYRTNSSLRRIIG